MAGVQNAKQLRSVGVKAPAVNATRTRSVQRSIRKACVPRTRKAQVITAQAVQVDLSSAAKNHAPAAPTTSDSLKLAAQGADYSRTVLGIILGGGAGTRLYPLTKMRAKPAVPLGANYRLIDIPVSNCLNSSINKIYCLTQFNSASLNRHLAQAYNSTVGGFNSRGFVEVLAASLGVQNKSWFQGTADAVRQYMWLIEDAMREGVEDLLILSGDHLYRMDYRDFVTAHRTSGATITIAALPCAEKQASAFGLMKIDASGKVIDFAEKPKGAALEAMKVDTGILGLTPAESAEKPFIASMGIYVIKAAKLKELLIDMFPDANDFGNEVIPAAKDAGLKVQAYAFQGYWEDIGTIEAFYNANLALTVMDKPNFSFYDKNAPIYTMSRFLPPSKVLDADVTQSIVGDGCVIRSGASINHSVIGLRSLINENVVIQDSMIMGSDYYETLEECALVPNCLPMGIGRDSVVRKAIVDKNARVGPNCQIVNKAGVLEANRDEEGYIIRDGIIVVFKDAILTEGTII